MWQQPQHENKLDYHHYHHHHHQVKQVMALKVGMDDFSRLQTKV